jgi:dolichol kinase
MIKKEEINRQLIHILYGAIISILLYFRVIDVYILFLITFIFIILSILIKNDVKLPFKNKVYSVQRSYEKTFPFKGVIFYSLGCAISVLVFDLRIAIASILILAFGDGISSLVGPFGKVKHPFNNLKFLEGIFAGFIVATIASSFLVPMKYAVLASLGAMIIEGFEFKINGFKIDDNLLIPLTAGLILHYSFLFFG